MHLKSKSNPVSKVKKANLKVKELKFIFKLLLITLISLFIVISLSVVFLLLISIITVVVYKLRLNRRNDRLKRVYAHLRDGIKLTKPIIDDEMLKYLRLSCKDKYRNKIILDKASKKKYSHILFSFLSTPICTIYDETYKIYKPSNDPSDNEVFKRLFESIKVKGITYTVSTCFPIVPYELNGKTYSYNFTHIFSYSTPDESIEWDFNRFNEGISKYIISLLSLKPTGNEESYVIDSMYRTIARTIANDCKYNFMGNLIKE